MLFPRRVLAAIRAGDVDLAFRRWERPRVRPGTRLRTAVGVLEVGAVRVVARADLGEEEARRAGFRSRDALLAMLDGRGRGEIHRIELRYAGPDPRVELRSRADLTRDELEEVARQLDRLDGASRHGPWTRAVLELIAARPETRAEELAAALGRDRLPFKRDVRKLKELGLTESLSPGYRLSPRGRTVVKGLRARADPKTQSGASLERGPSLSAKPAVHVEPNTTGMGVRLAVGPWPAAEDTHAC